MNHCRALVSAPRSRASVGNATFKIVKSSVITMRLLQTTTSVASLR
jgi:hypothetical protein